MTTIFDESSTDSKSSCSQAYHHQLLHSRNSWTQQSLTSPSSHSSSSHSYLSSTQRCRHRVCFSSVDVIEFSIILGDHPACRTGPALQTSNRVVRRMSFTFDDYEKERLPKRRSIENLYLTSEQRKELLGFESRVELSSSDQGDTESSRPEHDTRPSTAIPLRYTDVLYIQEAQHRIHSFDHRVDSLIERMDSLDRIMTHRTRERQHRQRLRRSALVSHRLSH